MLRPCKNLGAPRQLEDPVYSVRSNCRKLSETLEAPWSHAAPPLGARKCFLRFCPQLLAHAGPTTGAPIFTEGENEWANCKIQVAWGKSGKAEARETPSPSLGNINSSLLAYIEQQSRKGNTHLFENWGFFKYCSRVRWDFFGLFFHCDSPQSQFSL